MKIPRKQFLRLAAGFAALPAISRVTKAQGYPTRTVTLISPFPAGGPNDAIARVIAERMGNALGQAVVVENVTGGSGTIGTGRAARASADGYTLCSGGLSTHVINGALYSLPYDVLKDFEPISLTATFHLVFIAKKSLPANDLRGLINWLKENPDKASVGNAGAGTPGHLAGLAFQKETDTRFQLVPYRGNGLAMQDLLSGRLDFMISDPVVGIPQVRAGIVKALAVASKNRLDSAPDIPTVDEAGMPGFYVQNWNGIFAPKGTPKDVVSKVNLAIASTLDNATVRSRIAQFGLDVFPPERRGPSELVMFQRAEIDKWWPLIKVANVKGQRI